MKKVLSLVLVAAMLLACCFSFASCGKVEDVKKVTEQGYFYCGITVYDPMNYYDEDGNLIGFDTEFAKAVAEELGLQAKFATIDWPSKYLELNSGAIDVIWNGFTFGAESDGTSRTEYVDFSYAYLNNTQCVVVRKADLAQYTSMDSLAGKRGVAEGASSGEAVAQEATELYTAVNVQSKALMELAGNQADFAVIDLLMAQAMVGTGDYEDLAIVEAIELEPEVYAIGFRKGSDLVAKVNEAIVKLSQNGKLAEIAAKYNLSNALITNIGE